MREYLIATSCLLIALAAAAPAGAGNGEIFILGGLTSGSYGTDTDSEASQTRLAYVVGDAFQFRFDVSFLNVESEIGVRPSPGGPVPGRPQSGMGGAENSGTQGGSSATGSLGPGDIGQPDRSSPDPTEPEQEFEPISASGLGDIRLSVSHNLLGGGTKLYRLDGAVSVKAPTASEEDGLGTGQWDARIGVNTEYRFWSATGFAGAGWSYYGDPSWGELNDVVDGYVGLESEPLGGRVVISGWLEGNPEIVEGVGSRAAVGLGVRTTGRVRWRLLSTFGLTDAAEDFSLLFGASFGVQTPTVGTRGARR